MKDVLVKKNVAGEYECKAVTKAGRAIKFLVPVSTFSKILEHVDPDIFGSGYVKLAHAGNLFTKLGRIHGRTSKTA